MQARFAPAERNPDEALKSSPSTRVASIAFEIPALTAKRSTSSLTGANGAPCVAREPNMERHRLT
jgi:hypothetical protein